MDESVTAAAILTARAAIIHSSFSGLAGKLRVGVGKNKDGVDIDAPKFNYWLECGTIYRDYTLALYWECQNGSREHRQGWRTA